MRIDVRVIARSSRNEIVLEGELLKVRLTAAPVDGAANEALIKLLAVRLNLPRGALRVVRGATARQKVVEIEGITMAEVMSRLS